MRTIIRRLLTGFTLAAVSPAFSLGLGELSVSSGLGQPLQASIPLQGSEAELAPDCYRVETVANHSLPLPQDLRLTMEQPAGKPTLLRLSTKLAVNDPIIGFVLHAGCISPLQKEYALLLDPVEPVPEMLPLALPQMEAVDQPKPHSKPERASRVLAESLKSVPPPDAVTVTTSRTRKPRKTIDAEQPRLVLSGSTRRLALTREVGDGVPLQLDLSLPDASRHPIAVPTSAELSDENAALNHKPAYLEQRLVSLQKRNAELAQRATLAAPPVNRTEVPPASSVWPYFLLGFILLSSGTAWALHRRRRENYLETLKEEPANCPPARFDPAALAPAETDLADVEKPAGASLRDLDDDYLPRAQEGAEIHDSMSDEVEVFVAHGNAKLAVRLLENYIRQEPTESPVPWLLLLDLLQREGSTGKYEETRRQCKQHFNVEIPAYGGTENAAGKPGIEAYPHVMAELIHVWPTDKAIPYLDDLLRDKRNGSRAGFNFSAYNDIVLLRSIRDHDVPGPW